MKKYPVKNVIIFQRCLIIWKRIFKKNHTMEQLVGSSELPKSSEKIEYDELWCYKCKELQDNWQGWEHQLANRPTMKAHMHNKHNITIFEDVDMDTLGGFKYYIYPGKLYGYKLETIFTPFVVLWFEFCLFSTLWPDIWPEKSSNIVRSLHFTLGHCLKVAQTPPFLHQGG